MFGFQTLCQDYLCFQAPAYPKQKAETLGCGGGGALGRDSSCCRELTSVPKDLRQFSCKVPLWSRCQDVLHGAHEAWVLWVTHTRGISLRSGPGTQAQRGKSSQLRDGLYQTIVPARHQTLWIFWKAVKLS